MKGKDGKYHFMYIVTNSINNKIYIGVHSTYKIKDGYKGSGSILKKAFKKYGIHNFKKDVLEFFDTREEALRAEKDLVDINFLKLDYVYNRVIGGEGLVFYGDHPLKGIKLTDNHIQKLIKSIANRGGYNGINNPMYGKKHSKETKIRFSKARKGKTTGKDNPFYGRTHSEEIKIKISNVRKAYKGDKCIFSKKVLNIENGIFYDSIQEVAITYGIKYSTLRARLNGKNKTNFIKI